MLRVYCRQELYEEEQQEKERQKMLAELERRIRQRLELQREYELDEQIRKERLAKEREEEEKLRQMVCCCARAPLKYIKYCTLYSYVCIITAYEYSDARECFDLT